MIAGDQAAGLWASLTQILQQEVGDWDLSGPALFEPATRLKADLDLDSLALLRVITAIEAALGTRDLPFERVLVRDGHYVEDLTVAELVGFLAEVAR